jgi:hypothetical protein
MAVNPLGELGKHCRVYIGTRFHLLDARGSTEGGVRWLGSHVSTLHYRSSDVGSPLFD